MPRSPARPNHDPSRKSQPRPTPWGRPARLCQASRGTGELRQLARRDRDEGDDGDRSGEGAHDKPGAAIPSLVGEGWHLFAYPLAETALDGDPGAVPPSTVRLFRALGDDGRLRILRHLADGDLYLTEIADRMSLSKPTAKHHLAQLRAAGLVTVISTGGLTYYSLRRDRVAEVGLDLTRYLGATPS